MHTRLDVGVAQQIGACPPHAGGIPVYAAVRLCFPVGARLAWMLLELPAPVPPSVLLEAEFRATASCR